MKAMGGGRVKKSYAGPGLRSKPRWRESYAASPVRKKVMNRLKKKMREDW